jgi:hypothetical protein
LAVGDGTALLIGLLAWGSARADCPLPTQALVVDLAMEVSAPVVQVGEVVEVALVARPSDPVLSQSVAGLDALIAWDPTALSFCTNGAAGPPPDCEPGVVDGDYNWLDTLGPFVDDSGLDGLNNDLTDGLVQYSAFAQFGSPAVVPPEGLVIARFSFRAIDAFSTTTIELVSSAGLNACTQVVGGDSFGQIVTGALQATVLASCTPGDGDGDGDGDVDLFDVAGFTTCFGQSGAGLEANCAVFDLNCDAAVDGLDWSLLAPLVDGPT